MTKAGQVHRDIEQPRNKGQESKVKASQTCPTLCDPMNYTVHEILQARILEWIAVLCLWRIP